MVDISQLLEDKITGYEGPNPELISQAPAFYRLLTNLLGDPALPGRMRPLILSALAYFVHPVDILPEDLQGPGGLLDDLYLCAFVCNQVQQRLSSPEILEGNWEGQGAVLPLIHSILDHEKELVGENRDLILWYVGYEFLEPLL